MTDVTDVRDSLQNAFDTSSLLIRTIQSNIDLFWYFNVLSVSLTIILGSAASVLVVSQNESTFRYLKWAALACTVMLTIISGLTALFRIRDNYDNLNILQSEALKMRNSFVSRFTKNKKLIEDVDFSVEFHIEIERLERQRRKLIGSLGAKDETQQQKQ